LQFVFQKVGSLYSKSTICIANSQEINQRSEI